MIWLFAARHLSSDSPLLGIGTLELDAESGTAGVGSQAASYRLGGAIEDERVDAAVILEVLDV